VADGFAQPRRLVLVVFGAFILWGFGANTVWPRLMLAVDGVVTQRVDMPSLGAPRFTSAYVLRSPDGADVHYSAGATDASLARGQKIGTVFRKRRWQLGYRLNGKRVGFPVLFYGLTLAFGGALLVYGAMGFPAWWRGRVSAAKAR
jgi:hypothetical protein